MMRNRSFSGVIFLCDFDTESRGAGQHALSSIAARIGSDEKFDRQCFSNALVREKKMNDSICKGGVTDQRSRN